MAESNQVLIASLRADVAGFRRDLQQAVTAANQFGSQTSNSLNRIEASSQRVARSTSALSAGFRTLRNAVIALGFGKLISEGFQLAAQFASVERQLRATTGGARQAAEAYAFVRRESLRLGTDILQGATSFAKLSNAARGTSIEGQGVRDIFTAISTTTTALGLGTQEYGRLLLATNQILAKTRIQTEELNQIEEAGIPIRKQLADVLGVSGRELSKFLEQGLIPSEALLAVSKLLTAQYQELADEASLTTPIAFKTLTSVLKETVGTFFDGILSSQELNQLIRDMAKSVEEFGAAIDKSSIAEFVNQVIRLGTSIASFGSSVSGFFNSLVENLNSLRDRFLPIEGIREFIKAQAEALGATEKTTDAMIDLLIRPTGEFSLFQQLQTDADNMGIALDAATERINGFKGNIETLTDVFGDPVESAGELFAVIQEEGKPAAKSIDDIRAEAKKMGAQIVENIKLEKSRAEAARAAAAAEKQFLKDAENARDAIRKFRSEGNEAESKARIEDAKRLIAGLTKDELEAYKRLQEDRIDLARVTSKDITEIERLETIKRNAEIKKIVEEAEKRLTEIRFKEIQNRVNREEKANQKLLDAIKGMAESIEQEVRGVATEISEPLKEAFENIQNELSSLFVDALNGQLDDIGSFADAIKQTFIKTFAEIAAAAVIKPVIQGATGAAGAAGGIAGVSGGRLAAGVGAGLATSFVSQQALQAGGANSQLTGALSGAAGGAVSGAIIGSAVLPGWGTAIGAAAGAIVGGVIGLLGSGGGGAGASTIALRTSAGRPENPSEGVAVRGAFGFLSVVNEQSQRVNAQQAANVIAEIDRTIFNATTSRQRKLIEAALLHPANQTLIGKGAEDTDRAISEVIAARLRAQVQAVGGAAVATAVVGAHTIDADLTAIQQRVQDALNILRMIEEFEAGPQTEAAQALRSINDEFDILISRAQEFGIATVALEAERQRRVAEVAENVNKNVTQRILELTNPAQAAMAALAERQRIEFENAADANANLTELERLHVLERQGLAAELGEANAAVGDQSEALFQRVFDIINTGGVGNSPAAQIEEIFRAFNRAGSIFGPLTTQAEALREQFDRLKRAAQELGRPIGDIESSFRRQGQAIIQTFFDATTEMTPFGQQMSTLLSQFNDARDAAHLLGQPIGAITEAFTRARNRLQEQENERFRAEAIQRQAQVQAQFDLIQQFNRGTALTQFGQALVGLVGQFKAAKEAAAELGRGTGDLNISFARQLQTLREQALETIDAQLESRRQDLRSVGDLLRSFQTSAEQPAQLRLSAAQEQFQSALRGGSVQEVLGAANQLREIARQNFGSSVSFFGIQTQIEKALTSFQDREQRAIESERDRLIAQASREERQVLATEQNLQVLQRVANDGNAQLRTLQELVALSRRQDALAQQTQALLERTLAKTSI